MSGAVRRLLAVVRGVLCLLLESAKLISATKHILETSRVFRVACSEREHGADTLRMGSKTRHSPLTLAHAHLSHIWQGIISMAVDYTDVSGEKFLIFIMKARDDEGAGFLEVFSNCL